MCLVMMVKVVVEKFRNVSLKKKKTFIEVSRFDLIDASPHSDKYQSAVKVHADCFCGRKKVCTFVG